MVLYFFKEGYNMELWKKDLWLNDSIDVVFNTNIIEYDMSEAGFSLIQEFKLLPEKDIELLKTYGKDKRKIKIGLYQREIQGFAKELSHAFAQARRMFFEINDIKEHDIISINKDAIFIRKIGLKTKITEFIEFREKNRYTSYILLDKNDRVNSGKIPILYSPNKIDVKGIGDKNLEYHKEFMLDFISKYFYKMENDDGENVIRYCRRFITDYKTRKLDIGYYRRFDPQSQIECDESGDIIIDYNLYAVLLQLLYFIL